MKNLILKIWYQDSVARYFLLPLSWLFGCVSQRRKIRLIQNSSALPKPVIIVGNITVGGTGKTPLVIALVQRLQSMGIKPGVISRGYKGRATYPYVIDDKSLAESSGDEPLLIFQRCQCPVVVDPDRLAAANYLLTQFDVDIIISDDGMQHYRLPRQMEIAVVDSQRGFGNGYLLPAGPLREPVKRLDDVDFIIANGANPLALEKNYHTMALKPDDLQFMGNTANIPGKGSTVHALAAIGNPDRFFNTLTDMGFNLIKHPFPDHYHYEPEELHFTDAYPVIMTEKDAVKCRHFSSLNQHSYLPVNAQLSPEFWCLFEAKVNKLLQCKNESLSI